MDCKTFRIILKNYLSGDTDKSELGILHEHMNDCSRCRQEYLNLLKVHMAFDALPDLDPPEGGGKEFMLSLEQEINKDLKRDRKFKGSLVHLIIPIGIAASIMIFAGGYLTGVHRSKNILKDEQILALRKEVNDTKNLMILNLINQQSASKRILAANYAEELEEMKPEVMNALVYSLNNDYSTNVRLASLEAISRYSTNPQVRIELLNAFRNESDPVVQVNMINLMVLINEKSSTPIMEKLASDETLPVLVREQARKGLLALL